MDAQITYNTITRDNIGKLSVIFKQLVDRSSFVAIDTEFTGLNLQNLADDFGFDFRKWNTRESVGRLWEQGQEQDQQGQEQNGSQGYVVGGAENNGVNSDGNKRKFVSKKREVKKPKHEEFNDGRILRHLLRYVISSGGGKLGKRGATRVDIQVCGESKLFCRGYQGGKEWDNRKRGRGWFWY
ncbi:hypothetical protein AX774_g4876 [Zancudomyces culisetae]|uniref:Uncharacterized protein n=1 Tax=Zancudomyces culisetae TaxID=1213189 RepID=A0A1R1PL63_ZANCU|nr:hypothetical protein AX774_g4876 [Zancudomyces culisetae]|eukprot:OMH81663.1 hypothetical protein AX774_g4876 [Zancudomyces culisetae]